MKVNGSLDEYKAHLVAKEFMKMANLYFFETFSQVVKPTTIRAFLTITLCKGWGLRKIDMYIAILNGDLEKNVFKIGL